MESKSVNQLVFEGQLVINRKDEFLQILKNSLNNPLGTIIFIKNVEAMDISFLQMIIAYSSSLKKKGLELIIKPELNPETEKLLEKAGLNKFC
jgi:anti-anti-sigma regulatory factor